MRTKAYWEEYERQKQSLGWIPPREYDNAIQRIVESLDQRSELFETDEDETQETI